MLLIDKFYRTNYLDRYELKALIEANMYAPDERFFMQPGLQGRGIMGRVYILEGSLSLVTTVRITAITVV